MSVLPTVTMSNPWDTQEIPALPEGTTTLNLRDTWVTVLDGATLPRSIVHICITHSRVQVVRNLDQLPNLQTLDLSWSIWLNEFDCALPPGLWNICLNSCHYLTRIGSMARSQLTHLTLQNCRQLKVLPALPPTLQSLMLFGTGVETLPYLPDSLRYLAASDYIEEPYRSMRRRKTPEEYAVEVRNTQRRLLRTHCFSLIHEELMAAAWHPDRVSRWLAAGESVLDNVMGC